MLLSICNEKQYLSATAKLVFILCKFIRIHRAFLHFSPHAQWAQKHFYLLEIILEGLCIENSKSRARKNIKAFAIEKVQAGNNFKHLRTL